MYFLCTFCASSKHVNSLLIVSDAAFRDAPASMDTESSSGKEGPVKTWRPGDAFTVLCSPGSTLCSLLSPPGGGGRRLGGGGRSDGLRGRGQRAAAGRGGAAVRPVHEVVHRRHVRHRHRVRTRSPRLGCCSIRYHLV